MTSDRISGALNIEDLRLLAKARLPRMLFDYLEGGAEDEHGIRRNCADGYEWRFVPRYLRDVDGATLECTLLNARYGAPFGIAPTGFAGMLRPNADLFLAAEAERRRVPFILSGVSNASLESAAAVAPNSIWAQLYPTREPSVAMDMMERASKAGVGTIVCTIDLPTSSKRERDLRNGFGLPVRRTPRIVADALMHPAWTLQYLRAGGLPYFGSWQRYASPTASALEVATFVRSQSPAQLTWDALAAWRSRWHGKLIVKGILHPDDALQARDIGADGIIVSNHGGRQLDRAISSIAILPSVRKALGPTFPIMIDGGMRRGSDIVTALCLGANFVFTGRATLFGAVAGAAAGVKHAMDILSDEALTTMRQIGATKASDLGPHLLQSVRGG